jgi:HTH-type transcriptional regulator, transcriptional repressor of NAD biosynthesis genes
MIRGFITGSFRPFHKGHEALIDYAKANCDELTILITTLPDEVIPYKYRLKWVLSTYLDDPQIQIVADTVKEPKLTGDALSIWWGMYVTQKFGQFDRVFTSEEYGWTFAESMGAVHFPFDKARAQVPVSATAIREKPVTNWDYLNNFAKDYFVKKIAIVGTESTGKSTMTKQLAEYFSKKYGETITYFVNEAGDDIVQNSNNTKKEQIIQIAEEHAKRIIRQTRKANRVLFVDTDLNITKSYSRFLFKKDPRFEPWIERANQMDLYIYLLPDAPFIQDGRRLEKSERDRLHHSHRVFYPYDNNSVKEFNFEGGYEERLQRVIKTIEEFLSKY